MFFSHLDLNETVKENNHKWDLTVNTNYSSITAIAINTYYLLRFNYYSLLTILTIAAATCTTAATMLYYYCPNASLSAPR